MIWDINCCNDIFLDGLVSLFAAEVKTQEYINVNLLCFFLKNIFMLLDESYLFVDSSVFEIGHFCLH